MCDSLAMSDIIAGFPVVSCCVSAVSTHSLLFTTSKVVGRDSSLEARLAESTVAICQNFTLHITPPTPIYMLMGCRLLDGWPAVVEYGLTDFAASEAPSTDTE